MTVKKGECFFFFFLILNLLPKYTWKRRRFLGYERWHRKQHECLGFRGDAVQGPLSLVSRASRRRPDALGRHATQGPAAAPACLLHPVSTLRSLPNRSPGSFSTGVLSRDTIPPGRSASFVALPQGPWPQPPSVNTRLTPPGFRCVRQPGRTPESSLWL